jgi:hypothetical protein
MLTERAEPAQGASRRGVLPEGDDVPDTIDKLDAAALLVCCHNLLNDLGVIGSAARTLVERKDELPPHLWEALALTISDAVDRGAERLRVMVLAPAMGLAPESEKFR